MFTQKSDRISWQNAARAREALPEGAADLFEIAIWSFLVSVVSGEGN